MKGTKVSLSASVIMETVQSVKPQEQAIDIKADEIFGCLVEYWKAQGLVEIFIEAAKPTS